MIRVRMCHEWKDRLRLAVSMVTLLNLFQAVKCKTKLKQIRIKHTCRILEFEERKISNVSKELEAEKRRRAVIEETEKAANDGGFWWDEAVDDLGLEELEQYMAALEELKKNVSMKAGELIIMKANSSMMFGMNESSNHGGLGLMSDCAISTVPHGFDCANSSMMFGMNESANHGELGLMSDCATSTVPHGFDCANSSMMFGMNESANHGGLGFMSDCATSMIPHGFDFGCGQF
ncbi:hypothetical protein LOK49_LG08G00561 [Camellia lanceoleosa]|uniref:Uncharacterized protein n=1 Tax=Camellia lanceoleosa TaxID=1840588 RepID=A0ACC0GQK5_9ERIC|nr:hypothetical protein LOK49_LG08G00561 [Camellia lanceoleosa]